MHQHTFDIQDIVFISYYYRKMSLKCARKICCFKKLEISQSKNKMKVIVNLCFELKHKTKNHYILYSQVFCSVPDLALTASLSLLSTPFVQVYFVQNLLQRQSFQRNYEHKVAVSRRWPPQ